MKSYRDVFNYIMKRGWLNFLSDETYIKLHFYTKMGQKLNLENPQTFNEKIQWMKLYDKNPLYTQIADKTEVRKIIAKAIGEQYLVPLLGVWERFSDIDFSMLPEQFALKCNHDCASITIVKDKSKLDIKKTGKEFEKRLRKNHFWYGREWLYLNIKPKIMAEEYLEDETGELKDYKFYCFGGVPKLMLIATGRLSPEKTKYDMFDMEQNHLDLIHAGPNSPEPVKCPEMFEEMKRLASVLSAGFAHIRVDFYEVHRKIYVGELTLTNGSGTVPFYPIEWDYQMGQWFVLPEHRQ